MLVFGGNGRMMLVVTCVRTALAYCTSQSQQQTFITGH